MTRGIRKSFNVLGVPEGAHSVFAVCFLMIQAGCGNREVEIVRELDEITKGVIW
jgi:hypothetical protein